MADDLWGVSAGVKARLFAAASFAPNRALYPRHAFPQFLHIVKTGPSEVTTGKPIQVLSAGLRVDSPWISPRHPWRGERVENTVDVRSSHATGFPH